MTDSLTKAAQAALEILPQTHPVSGRLRAALAAQPQQAPETCQQVNSGVRCDVPRKSGERLCPDCNPQPQQAKQTVWRGAARCDMCEKVITRNLYDAATRHGPWATMCASCFSCHGLGVGTGRGQQYRQQPDGLFVKIAG